MNLLIENLNSSLLNRIDANVIKTLQGEFTKEDLKEQLVNLYYNKVIIDITAIKNNRDLNSLFDFLYYFEKDKVIILLDESTTKECISKLVQSGFYNFTKNVGGINYLIEHPNSLNDVEKYIIANSFQNPLFSSNSINTNTNANINVNVSTNNNAENVSDVTKETNLKDKNQIIIGIQNLTPHAGATTLMYMMVKELRNFYRVQGIEMMEQNSIYLRDESISESTSLEDLKMKLKLLTDKEVVIIDLNDIDGSSICDYLLYLVEPGIISLTKLLTSNKDFSKILSDGKIILNRSALADGDLNNFEYETKLKVFYNLGNMNDRSDRIQKVTDLLIKLGFDKFKSGGFFSLFK